MDLTGASMGDTNTEELGCVAKHKSPGHRITLPPEPPEGTELKLIFTQDEVEGLIGDLHYLNTPATFRDEERNPVIISFWEEELLARLKDAKMRWHQEKTR